MQEFNGKGSAPGSGSVEVGKKKTNASNDMYPHEDLLLCVSSLV